MKREICPFAMGFIEQDLTCGATAYLKPNPLCKNSGLYCSDCKYLIKNTSIIIKNGKSEVQW